MEINKVTFAFAAAIESLYQIAVIGHTGIINKGIVDHLLKGVLKTEAVTSTSIYPMELLQDGLNYFCSNDKLDSKNLKEVNFYIPRILKLTNIYLEDQEVRKSLGNEIVHIKETLSHQENKSLFVGKHLADWYKNNIFDQNKFAIQIYGSQEFLTKDINLIYVRALLVSAVRATVLWQQMGGTQLNFILNRSKMAISARHMMELI